MSRMLLVVAAVTVISGCATKSSTVSQSAAPQPAAAVYATSYAQTARNPYQVEWPRAVVPAPWGAEYFGAPRDSARAHCIRLGGVWRPTARECEVEAQ